MSRFALPYLAAARVVGPDAAAFLQAQLSADLSSLPAGGAGFACYCSPRGQVHALLLVLRSDEGFMVAGSAELLPALLQRLRRFVLRSRVDLVAADELTVWGLERTAANPEQDGPAAGTAAGLWYGIGTGGAATPADDVAAWKARELQHGVAWLGPATTERFIPQMLGFERIGAVSFSKGCYPGQEVIARARYLGRVKRKPLRLVVDEADAMAGSVHGDLVPGAALSLRAGADRLEATLIDLVPLAHRNQILLFLVAPETGETVTAVTIGGRDYRCATI